MRGMTVVRPVLDVVVTIAIAVLLLGAFFTFYSGNASFGLPEALRVLFNFMDVGLGLWVVLLVVFTIRGAVSAGRSFLLLLVGAVVNLVVVITVGLVQTGGWAGDLIRFAMEAGVACLMGGALTVPFVHRAPKRISQIPPRLGTD